jgi:hypothetical protein
LQHAGLCYDSFPLEELSARLSSLNILLTVGETKLPDDLATQLPTWIENGGVWISIAGLCGQEEVFGVEAEAPAFSSWGGGPGVLGEGYLHPDVRDHPILGHVRLPLHFFNGMPVKPKGANVLASVRDAHDRPTSRARKPDTLHRHHR